MLSVTRSVLIGPITVCGMLWSVLLCMVALVKWTAAFDDDLCYNASGVALNCFPRNEACGLNINTSSCGRWAE